MVHKGLLRPYVLVFTGFLITGATTFLCCLNAFYCRNAHKHLVWPIWTIRGSTWKYLPMWAVSAPLVSSILGFVLSLLLEGMRGGLVVSMLYCQSRGLGLKSWPGQKFNSRFLLHLPTKLCWLHWPYIVSVKTRWWGRGLSTRPHMPRLRKWSR